MPFAHCPVRPDPPDPDSVDPPHLSIDRLTEDEVKSITRLRDTKMSLTLAGQRWVDLFDKHRFEVRSIFGADEVTMRQVDSAIRGMMPLIVALAEPDDAPPTSESAEGVPKLEAKHVDAALAALAAIQSRASTELSKDIDELVQEMALARFVGDDIGSVWRAIGGK